MVMKESHEKCPNCKGKVWFLCSSPKLISLPTGAPSHNDVSSCGLQNPKSSKASGDTNSEEDICIPAIYVKSCDVTLDLNLSIQIIQTNKPARESAVAPRYNKKYTKDAQGVHRPDRKAFPIHHSWNNASKKEKKCLKCRVALYFIGMDGFA